MVGYHRILTLYSHAILAILSPLIFSGVCKPKFCVYAWLGKKGMILVGTPH